MTIGARIYVLRLSVNYSNHLVIANSMSLLSNIKPIEMISFFVLNEGEKL